MAADAFMNALSPGLVGYVSYLAPCRQRLIRHYMTAVPATLRRIAGVRARAFDVGASDPARQRRGATRPCRQGRQGAARADPGRYRQRTSGSARRRLVFSPCVPDQRTADQSAHQGGCAAREGQSRRPRRTGFGTPTPATRSTTARRLRWSAKRSALAKQIELGQHRQMSSFLPILIGWTISARRGSIKNDSEQLWPCSSDAT